MKPKLISFELCPFVQRSVITLLEKDVDFDITYIDLEHPPEWFLKISPFGKVPVLQVGDAVIFESAVINEYLDETNPPPMHPQDPLLRAKNRAWIVFGESILFTQHLLFVAKDEQTVKEKRQELLNEMERLEGQLGTGPYFNGANLSLVDTAYAPAFMRLDILVRQFKLNPFENTPKVRNWSESLLGRESVKKSVVPDFEQKFLSFLKEKGSYLTKS